MSSTAFNDDLASSNDVDWVEHQFFTRARLSQHDLDWGPVAPMPQGPQRAMLAALGTLLVALVGVVVFMVYATLIMPVPVPLGAERPALPPSAAGAASR